MVDQRNNKQVEKALKFYETGQYIIKKNEEMTSVSKSTLFRERRKRKEIKLFFSIHL